jgi:inosine-uridine nucleoside N-ribohydrolase
MFSTTLFEPSSRPSHKEILRILEDNPPDTITLIAIGPLTNLALAAAESPTIFMKAKEVVVMGGTISEPGNITPVGEFNCIADATAAARLYALTSPNPASTMPPDTNRNDLPANLKKEELGERRLRITMFPLDITTPHTVSRVQVEEKTKPLIKMGSPLAEWVGAFMAATFKKSESLYLEKEGLGGGASFMCLHDIVCIWYASASSNDPSGWQIKEGEDIRVETQGQWTTGMCVVDKRHMKMLEIDNDDGEVEVSGDTGNWLQKEKGNRLGRCVGTPGAENLAPLMLTAIFG